MLLAARDSLALNCCKWLLNSTAVLEQCACILLITQQICSRRFDMLKTSQQYARRLAGQFLLATDFLHNSFTPAQSVTPTRCHLRSSFAAMGLLPCHAHVQ